MKAFGSELYILTVYLMKTLVLSGIQLAPITVPTRLYLPLFITPSGFAQSVSEFFVNLSPVANRKDPNEPGFAIDFLDEAEPFHIVVPQAG